MSADLHHECGVTAVSLLAEPYPGGEAEYDEILSDENVATLIPRVLLDLQGRGQLAAGLTCYRERRPQLLRTYKDVGTVLEVFRLSHPGRHQQILGEYEGSAAIGHTRYATCGLDDVRYAQPFERIHGRLWKWFAFAFNGNLANYRELRRELEEQRQYHFMLESDTEIIMHALAQYLRSDRPPPLPAVMSALTTRFDGAYNLVFLDALGRVFAARDPLGFRPMSWAVQGRLFAAASESAALMNLGFRDVRSLEPGQMAIVEDGRLRFERFAPAGRRARCFFEWVYFANDASIIDDVSVDAVRNRMGERLAALEDQPLDDDCLVVPVPDTARTAASAFAYRLGLRTAEGILRNRYVGRTFIQPSNIRGWSAKRKYTVLPPVVGGKRVFLLEDSIVRSTTLATLVAQLRQSGVKEVHARVACPPIVSPCFYGIDMSTRDELFAPPFVPEEYEGVPAPETLGKMGTALGLDSLRYLSVPDMVDCLRTEPDSLCLGCVRGDYPTPCGNRLALEARERAAGTEGRAYQ